MKTITKQVEQGKIVEITYYVCEVCGAESQRRDDINECEKKHKQANCKHRWSYDVYSAMDECRISRFCLECHLDQESRALDRLTPAQAKAVWEMLEGEK